MVSNLLKLLAEKESEAMTDEELRLAVEAVDAKIEKAKAFKDLALKFHDEHWFKRADEEERMLTRLLAEYEVLGRRGGA